MKIFLITFGGSLLGFVAADLQVAFGRINRLSLGNNFVWATAFALIAAGLCL